MHGKARCGWYQSHENVVDASYAVHKDKATKEVLFFLELEQPETSPHNRTWTQKAPQRRASCFVGTISPIHFGDDYFDAHGYSIQDRIFLQDD